MGFDLKGCSMSFSTFSKNFAKSAWVLASLCLAVCLFSAPAFPQGNTGRILGAVTDQSGGTVAGATVTVTDTQRGTSRVLVTDSGGEYVATGLQPGTYTVRAEAKGFKVFERKNLLLETGKDLQIDVALVAGAATETITVTEEAPLVDTTSTTLGGTLSNQIINDRSLDANHQWRPAGRHQLSRRWSEQRRVLHGLQRDQRCRRRRRCGNHPADR